MRYLALIMVIGLLADPPATAAAVAGDSGLFGFEPAPATAESALRLAGREDKENTAGRREEQPGDPSIGREAIEPRPTDGFDENEEAAIWDYFDDGGETAAEETKTREERWQEWKAKRAASRQAAADAAAQEATTEPEAAPAATAEPDDEEPATTTEKVKKAKKAKKKKKSADVAAQGVEGGDKAMPPGLEKKDELPPGLAMQVERGGTLPPGLEKRRLPPGLEARLPALEPGTERLVVEDDVVLVESETGKVLDVLEDVIRKRAKTAE